MRQKRPIKDDRGPIKSAASRVDVLAFDSEQAGETALAELHHEPGNKCLWQGQTRQHSVAIETWRFIFLRCVNTKKRVKDGEKTQRGMQQTRSLDQRGATSANLINFYSHYLITHNQLQRSTVRRGPLIVFSWSLASYSAVLVSRVTLATFMSSAAKGTRL